jgi:hypothetical protein
MFGSVPCVCRFFRQLASRTVPLRLSSDIRRFTCMASKLRLNLGLPGRHVYSVCGCRDHTLCVWSSSVNRLLSLLQLLDTSYLSSISTLTLIAASSMERIPSGKTIDSSVKRNRNDQLKIHRSLLPTSNCVLSIFYNQT